MANNNQPTEFGGLVNKAGIQPPVRPDGGPGHSPSPAERHTLFLRNGDETGTIVDDEHAHFTGLLTQADQIKKMRDAGLLEKGVELG